MHLVQTAELCVNLYYPCLRLAVSNNFQQTFTRLKQAVKGGLNDSHVRRLWGKNGLCCHFQLSFLSLRRISHDLKIQFPSTFYFTLLKYSNSSRGQFNNSVGKLVIFIDIWLQRMNFTSSMESALLCFPLDLLLTEKTREFTYYSIEKLRDRR